MRIGVAVGNIARLRNVTCYACGFRLNHVPAEFPFGHRHPTLIQCPKHKYSTPAWHGIARAGCGFGYCISVCNSSFIYYHHTRLHSFFLNILFRHWTLLRRPVTHNHFFAKSCFEYINQMLPTSTVAICLRFIRINFTLNSFCLLHSI